MPAYAGMTNQKNLQVYVHQERGEVMTRKSVRDYNGRSSVVQFTLVAEFSLLNRFCSRTIAKQKSDGYAYLFRGKY